ncbi:DNA repair protein [Eggerthellaceae bacterium zg-1084]|uniref:Y-family DNA polymerase n=1 Tax=Berryella wangjianweii TaxID=2734634 RepID=UPI001553C8B6|nr:DNA repair protein [Berryella wangjianweii]NPD31419.1 DNA repair protein [Berryella wangjianweii]NPD32274.1 DNA repair protein [Eggerthellaceae bacterium zg-997]
MPSTYLCIDLKSFYASVECIDRGLDPLQAPLVVADPDRGRSTICLAVSPALKRLGIPGRCRVFELPSDVPYIMATPRMRRYMEVSAQVYQTYLGFVGEQDVHAYSVDECFIHIGPYLNLYDCDARTLAHRMIEAVRLATGVPATVGIGPNLFLAKVALDLFAKADAEGIAELSPASFFDRTWFHQPITDIWGIGRGVAARLHAHGVVDLAGVAALDPAVLRREFGKNAEYLIDHAWGQEPCTMEQIRSYHPKGRSLTSGQVLPKPYALDQARLVVSEMAESISADLMESGLMAGAVGLSVGYELPATDRRTSAASVCAPEHIGDARSPSSADHAVWVNPNHVHQGGQRVLPHPTCSYAKLREAALKILETVVPAHGLVHRVNISVSRIIASGDTQASLFDEPADTRSERCLRGTLGEVRRRFGKSAVLYGISLREGATARERNRQIGGHRA